MTDRGTIVLYALSTMAQTCAALAALVGAVGLFRVGGSEHGRRARFDDMSKAMGDPMMTYEAVLQEAAKRAEADPEIAKHVRGYREHNPIVDQTVRLFWILEGVNLTAILLSLVGFLFVEQLAACWYFTAVSLVLVSGGVVATTGFCVKAWAGKG